MALNYPGIGYLTGYDKPDLVSKFAKGYEFGGGIADEQGAQKALGDYVKSLYMGSGTQPPAIPAPQASQAVNPAVPGQSTAPWMQDSLDGYVANLRQAESGGNDAAKNPNSSATGRYQITDGTWAGLMKTHPELGLTPDGRMDPAQQDVAVRALTSDNAAALKAKGIPVNPGNLYAAHFLGAGGASSALSYADDTPLVAALPPEVITANPNLQNMTVGDFKQWTAKQGGGPGGGYQAPLAPQAAPQPSAGTAGGLPPREVLSALFANPNTRGFAAQLVQAQQKGLAPPTMTDDMKEYLMAQQDPAFARFLGRSKPAAAPSDVQEYQYYVQQEQQAGRKPLSYLEFVNAQKGSGLTVTTNPDGTTTVQQGGAGPGKLTEGQGKDIGFYTRGLQANQGLHDLEGNLTDFVQKTASSIPLGIGNYLQTPAFRQAKNQADNFLAAILRKDTGAAITDKEFDLYGPMFLPIPGDDPATIGLKRQKRATALLAIRSGLGTAEAIAAANEANLGLANPLPEARGDATGNAPAKPQTQADFDALPSGAQFIDPEDNQLYVKP